MEKYPDRGTLLAALNRTVRSTGYSMRALKLYLDSGIDAWEAAQATLPTRRGERNVEWLRQRKSTICSQIGERGNDKYGWM